VAEKKCNSNVAFFIVTTSHRLSKLNPQELILELIYFIILWKVIHFDMFFELFISARCPIYCRDYVCNSQSNLPENMSLIMP